MIYHSVLIFVRADKDKDKQEREEIRVEVAGTERGLI